MPYIPAKLRWKNKCYPPLCRSLLVSWQYQSLSFVIGGKGPINEQKWLCVGEIRRKVFTGAQYEAFHRVCSSHQGSAQRPNHSWIAFDLILVFLKYFFASFCITLKDLPRPPCGIRAQSRPYWGGRSLSRSHQAFASSDDSKKTWLRNC